MMTAAGAAYVLTLVVSAPSGKMTRIQIPDLPTYAACLQAGVQTIDPERDRLARGWAVLYVCDRAPFVVLTSKGHLARAR